MFRFFGGDVHVFAVCQPSVPVLAATALMEAEGDPAVPLTLILAGGPVDTRINRDRRQHAGRGARHRLVPPQRHHQRALAVSGPRPAGLSRLPAAFGLHDHEPRPAHAGAEGHVPASGAAATATSAEKHREFYDEYLAVMDLTAEFYLQTVDTVFVQHLMPRGLMTIAGRPIDLAAIRRPALMTVEGEKDDITGTGQCRAAHRPVRGHCAGAARCTSSVRRSATTAFSTARASAPRSRRAWPSSCARTILAPAPTSRSHNSSTWRRCRARGHRAAGARGTRLQLPSRALTRTAS